MAAPRKFSDETIQQIVADFHSDMSGVAIGKKYGCDYFRTIRKIWMTVFSEYDIKERHRRLSALSKAGKKNPMFGKYKEKHHRYKPVHKSTQGYRLIEAPRWYAGSTDKNGKASEHIIAACLKYRLRKLPDGCVVHHKDENKMNNHPDNLEILSRGQHMVTHRWLRHKKKVQRLSRKGVRPKQGGSAQRPDEDDDIV